MHDPEITIEEALKEHEAPTQVKNRIMKVFKERNIKYVHDLSKLSYWEIYKIPKLGSTSMKIIGYIQSRYIIKMQILNKLSEEIKKEFVDIETATTPATEYKNHYNNALRTILELLAKFE